MKLSHLISPLHIKNQLIHLINLKYINNRQIHLISLQQINNPQIHLIGLPLINNKVTKTLQIRQRTGAQLMSLQNIKPLALLSITLKQNQHIMSLNMSQNLPIMHLHNILQELTVIQILELFRGLCNLGVKRQHVKPQ